MKFEDGQLLNAIYLTDGDVIAVGSQCDSIIVSMENGQMGYVPWFEVWKDGQINSKWNATMCEGVGYMVDDE